MIRKLQSGKLNVAGEEVVFPGLAGRSASRQSRAQSPRTRQNGTALVIILAFLVLLTGLVVAFFSRALTERQVSNSSVAETKADFLARSAAGMIVGDLKQEIVDGSKPSPSSTQAVYLPASPANIVPQQSGVPTFGGTSTIPNLIRRSVRDNGPTGANPMPSPGVPSRASAVNSTTDPSFNRRSIPISRWNTHYLIPRHNAGAVGDCTPISPLNTTSPEAEGFTPPDWVFVTPSGPKVLAAPDSDVIGRYAYAIYDEGGLLDANAAGYPRSSTDHTPAYKGSAAFADLTQLPVSSTATLPQSQVDTLIGWRNYATAQPGGSLTGYSFDASAATRYYKSVQENATGFLSVNPQPYPSPVTSASRTDQMFTSRQALIRFCRSTGISENALQYLGTFTRDLNRPNFVPRAYPAPPSGLNPVPITYAGDTNNTNPSDTNPVVQSVFYGSGAPAKYRSQPVVAQRFPLSRLALFSDPVANAADIQKYFGLSRTVGTVKDGYTWNYVGRGTTNTIPKTLDQIAAMADVARDPDFFEMLQAAVLKGSLGVFYPVVPQTSPAGRTPDSPAKTIMQMGADLIDQYKADGVPTTIRIRSPRGSSGGTEDDIVSGIQNLPYFSEMLLRPYRPQSDATRFTLNGYLLMELWNPHKNASMITAPSGATGFFPSKLRLCFDARGGTVLVNKQQVSQKYMAEIMPNGTTVQVEFNHSARFAEPTVLDAALVNSNPSNNSDGSTTPGWAEVTEGVNSRSGFLVGSDSTFPDQRLTPGAPYKYTTLSFTGANPHVRLQFQDEGGVWRDYQGAYTTINEIPSLTLFTGQGSLATVENSFSPFNSQTANPAFTNFDYVGTLSLQQEDPRGSVGGSPFMAQSTYNKSIRPGSAVVAGTNVSGAYVTQYTLGAYPSYNSPVLPASQFFVANTCFPAMYNENAPSGKNVFIQGNSGAVNAYAVDMDGVLRPGDGYYGANPYPSGNLDSRPVLLHRPFHSVGEMGYAYRGRSWKSINFFSPESADAGLLDFFSMDQTPVVAGKINLNTRQPIVLQAMLQGAYQIPTSDGSSPETLETADAAAIASAIVTHTAQTPLASRADLVRELLVDPALANPPGSTANGAIDAVGGSTSNTLKAKREAFIRALADAGTTRTWNLLIDIVAQTGQYPPQATRLDQFTVHGEKHYWLHVAIDRYTGEIIDQQWEVVNE